MNFASTQRNYSILAISIGLFFIAEFHMFNAYSQSLPTASRTIFKCENGGKIVYSDNPCLGAKVLNIQPSRGLNKSTGRIATGADVHREQIQEMYADAIRPLSGLNRDQYKTVHHRVNLSQESKNRCAYLDKQIPIAASETFPNVPEKTISDQILLELRMQFRDLRC
jgi:hypothetical protein